MNKHLLEAMAYAGLMMESIMKAEKELYLDDVIAENDEAIMAIQNAIDKIEAAYSGAVDDVRNDYIKINHKPIIEMKNAYIGVVK